MANDLILVPPITAPANTGVAVVRKSCGVLTVMVVPLAPMVTPLLLANVSVPELALIAAVPVVPVTVILALLVVT